MCTYKKFNFRKVNKFMIKFVPLNKIKDKKEENPNKYKFTPIIKTSSKTVSPSRDINLPKRQIKEWGK